MSYYTYVPARGPPAAPKTPKYYYDYSKPAAPAPEPAKQPLCLLQCGYVQYPQVACLVRLSISFFVSVIRAFTNFTSPHRPTPTIQLTSPNLRSSIPLLLPPPLRRLLLCTNHGTARPKLKSTPKTSPSLGKWAPPSQFNSCHTIPVLSSNSGVENLIPPIR